VNDHGGGRRPERYWPAPLADSMSQAPPELMIPERRLSGRVVSFSVIAGLAVLAAILIPLISREYKKAGPSHTITIPASVDQYERMTGSVANRTVETIRQAARNEAEDGSSANIADNAIIVVYQQAKDPGRRFIFLGGTAATDRTLAKELRAHSASRNADDMFDDEGGVTGTRDFDPGPLGGVLRCGRGNGGTTAMCVWIDGSTVGMFVSPRTDVGTLARIALDFRGAAEH
jgi:hypothetical protein